MEGIHAHQATDLADHTTKEVYTSIEGRLDEQAPLWLLKYDVPSVAIAFIRDGALKWTRVYGERAEGIPATPQTLYNTASLAKPVFAEAILRLVADGRFSLDETLASHWVDPDIANDPRHEKLTLRIALSHRTGFANWRRETNGILTFQFEPGTSVRYSGEGYEYASRFAREKTGESLDDLAGESLFRQLGMTSTAFAGQEWFAGRLANPKGPEGRYGVPSVQASGNAADDLYTTIGDYATFLVAVMNGSGIPPAIAAQRDSIHALEERATCDSTLVAPCPERIGHGLGWFIFEYPEERILWHNGADWGERALVFYSPQRREGAVIFTNGANGIGVIMEAMNLLFSESPLTSFLNARG